MTKKIAIIGPESTGKSSLCRQLAEHYQTSWVPEYAREYLKAHGMAYNFDTLLEIAKGQVRLEDEFLTRLTSGTTNTPANNAMYPDSQNPGNHHPDKSISVYENAQNSPHPHPDKTFQGASQKSVLFIDTEMYVMKVWSEFVFQKCHQWIIDQIVARHYDLFLLCDIDLEWSFDPLREYPTKEPRQQLFRMYHDIVINQPQPWTVISGDYQQRLSEAIAAIDRII